MDRPDPAASPTSASLLSRREHARLVRAEKLAGVGRVAAQLAHQLNTPLGSILLCAETLATELEGQELGDEAKIVLEAARTCQRVVRRLQNFSRTAGVVVDRLNFCHIFHRVHQLMRPTLDAAGVQLKFGIERGRYLVRGDPAELEHLLFALLENAVDASQSGDVVRVAMTIDYDDLSLTMRIRDDGPGVSEGDEEVIFEPFYTTKEEGRGTGLGLAIARRVAKSHGGSLRAHANTGGGGEFQLRLPLSPLIEQALRMDPAMLEVHATPFEVLQARARGEYAAGCERVGVVGATSRPRPRRRR